MPARGEVWVVDLGMIEKVRPAVVLSGPAGPKDRDLITVIPHTTTLRGSWFEIHVPLPFLKPGAFLAQSPATVPTPRAQRRLGRMTRLRANRVPPRALHLTRVFCRPAPRASSRADIRARIGVPEGLPDNSPALQRRESRFCVSPVPRERLNKPRIGGVRSSRPFGTENLGGAGLLSECPSGTRAEAGPTAGVLGPNPGRDLKCHKKSV